MQNLSAPSPPSPALPSSIFNPRDPKFLLYFFLAPSLFFLLFILSLSSSSSSPSHSRPDPHLFPTHQTHRIVYNNNSPSDPTPPSIGYLISGSRGDAGRVLRLLLATYHPRNHYLLHLDPFAPQAERESLALRVQSNPIFKAAQNVDVIGKADFVYPKGSSPLSFTLHSASILLRLSKNWDWFISLNADDYPLVTQDGLYLAEGTQMFFATQKREYPSAYRLFTGSSFSILSRSFMEFCILATDNLPRILLMYFANTPSSLSNYFPTVLCNSRQFQKTIINQNLVHASFDKLSRGEPRPLNSSDFKDMVRCGAAFARKFQPDDPVLDLIDRKLLGRSPESVVPGGWCLGEPGNGTCSTWGDAGILRPGRGSRRLEKAIVGLLSNDTLRSHQCILE